MNEAQPKSEAGFSVVEALIALTIIAAMTAVLVETATQNARARSAMQNRRTAMLVAQSVLDRAAAGDAAPAGQWEQLSWRLDRQPYGPADPLDAAPVEQLTVTVTGANQRPLATLATVRIRP